MGLLVALGLTVVIIVWIISGIGGSPRWSWFANYRHDSEEPYGLSVLHRLLPSYCNAEIILLEDAPSRFDLSGHSGNYLAIGKAFRLSEADLDSLSEWVARGNTVFLAAEDFPLNLLPYDAFNPPFAPEWMEELESKALRLDFAQPPFDITEPHKLVYRVQNRDMEYSWTLFLPDLLKQVWPLTETIGTCGEDKANLVRLPYGDGQYYLLSTPLALTNYFLVQPDGRDYAERLLSHLSEGEVLWDTGSRMNHAAHEKPPSPLQFILQHAGLRTAWYLLLLIGLLYFVFRTRRRQAAIPLLDPKVNQSIQYLDSVARLYYLQRKDHRAIAEMMREHFFSTVRERFHIRQLAMDDEGAERISSVSGWDLSAARDLLQSLREINSAANYSDYSLLRLYRLLEDFYRKSL